MLKVTLKSNRSIINNPEGYFDYRIGAIKNDKATKYLIKAIDNAEVISDGAVKSNRNGRTISVQHLSTGCKIALIVLYTNNTVNFVEAGDNVFDALLEVSRIVEKDINIYVNNIIICNSDIKISVDGNIMTARKFAINFT